MCPSKTTAGTACVAGTYQNMPSMDSCKAVRKGLPDNSLCQVNMEKYVDYNVSF